MVRIEVLDKNECHSGIVGHGNGQFAASVQATCVSADGSDQKISEA